MSYITYTDDVPRMDIYFNGSGNTVFRGKEAEEVRDIMNEAYKIPESPNY